MRRSPARPAHRTRLGAAACAAALAVLPAAAASVRLRPLTSIYVDGTGAPLRQPEGVACNDASDTIVVADTGNGRLLRFTATPEEVRALDVVTVAELTRPIHAEIASDGEILALDGRQRRILRISAAGQLVGHVEPSGAAGGFVPRSFKLDAKDVLHVLDVFAGRVIAIDRAGTVKREISLPEPHGAFADLALAPGDRVFAVDGVTKILYQAGPGESTLSPVGPGLAGAASFPAAIVADGLGDLFVADQHGGAVLVLGLDGVVRSRQSGPGWRTGLLRYPTKLCVDRHDHLFVADRANSRVQVFAIVR